MIKIQLHIAFKKLFNIKTWRRIYLDRLSSPLIYNLVSIFVLLFGDFKAKISYDLVQKIPYAFGIDLAFSKASNEKTKKIYIIEFGVASGDGLFRMALIAKKLSKIYKIDYEIIGFDTGLGMPKPIDYRDHPEKYREKDFPPINLRSSNLPPKTSIIYGEIRNTMQDFYKQIKSKKNKIAFVSVDVDYYSSTVDCLEIFKFDSKYYLSSVPIYFDDIAQPDHNEYCGELLAISEFNKNNLLRKICKMRGLRSRRKFKNARYLDQMFFCHIFDHAIRKIDYWKDEKRQVLINPFIS